MSEMDNSWVLIELNKQRYGIRTEYIQEMVLFSGTSRLPDHPDYVRGVVNLRGTVIPIMDLRKRLGMSGRREELNELVELLKAREQDHVNWLNELKASVEENREFKLTSDPHACAFGRWYDNFKTENQLLKTILNKFDNPHKAIHEIANVVEEMVKKEDYEGAKALIKNTWNCELSEMRFLFNEARTILIETSREIVIVIDYNNMLAGFVADSVEDVLDILPEDIMESPKIKSGRQSDFIDGLAKVNNDVNILLNIEALISGCRSEKARENAV